MASPFLAIRKINQTYQTQGVAHCLLGHKIPTGHDDTVDGIFAEWTWDGTILTVKNDRYGFYPLYYFVTDDEIVISSSLIQLLDLGAPADFDNEALAVFLRIGFFIGEDTPFKAIRVLPPSASFRWESGKLSVSGRLHSSKLQRMKHDDVIDTYIALFRRSIERRVRNSGVTAVPLSGGRDSRHILLELCHAGFPPSLTVTLRHLPPRVDGDAETAAQLTHALKISHTIVDQPKSRLLAELKKNVETNFSTLEHGWLVPMADFFDGRVSSMYDGVAGDVLSAGHFLNNKLVSLYEAEDLVRLAEELLSADNPEPALKSMLTAAKYQQFSHELAVSRLITELQRHTVSPNPVTSFFFWNRTRRVATLSCGLFASVPNVYSPYLDHDLFDFLTSQPAGMFLDHQLHTDAIARAYPEFAHIPYENKSYTAINRNHFRKFALEVSNYHLSHRSRLLRETFLIPRLIANLASGRPDIVWLSALTIYLTQLNHLVLNRGKLDITV